MAWNNVVGRLFAWADSGNDQFVVGGGKGFRCAVAAVHDRQDPSFGDYSCAGDGFLGKGFRAPDTLELRLPMVYSDRVSSGSTGQTESWTIEIARTGEMTVTMSSWPGYRDLPFDGEPVYSDKGGGNFVTGFVHSPAGWWHLAISLDRLTFDR